MKITVTAINPDEAVLVRGTSALGWPGKFGCPLGIGDAIFIPARGFEHNLRVGSSLSVETSYDEVSDVRMVDDNAPDGLCQLENPGDYEVTGVVVFAAPQGLVRVSVRGLIFTLDRKDLAANDPQVGQHLSFRLNRLTLWDTVT